MTRTRSCTHDGKGMTDEICLQLNETWHINETTACYNAQNPCTRKLNPLTTGIFTVFGHSLLEGRVLHSEA